MALIFPPNPTTGEEFTGPFGEVYTWDGEKWTLTAGGTSPGGTQVIISETAPPNPTAGTLWWATDVVKMYLWDGTEWVIVVNTPDVGGPITTVPQNYVDNSSFTINQRGYVSGTTLTALQYGLDRWRAVAEGTATLVLDDTSGIIVVDITSGVLVQVIDNFGLEAGPYTLSWAGTATCQAFSSGGINVVAGSSPLQNNLLAGEDVTLQFTGGTLSQVQLQQGSVATPWQPQVPQVELARCCRYYQQLQVYLGGMFFESGNLPLDAKYFPVAFRASPTMTWLVGPAYGGVVSLANIATLQPTMYIPQVAVTGPGTYVVNGAAGFSADL